jgi:hypothetical protein
MRYYYNVYLVQRGFSALQRLATHMVMAFRPKWDLAAEWVEGAAPRRGISGGRIPWTFHRLFIRGLGTAVAIAAMLINIR